MEKHCNKCGVLKALSEYHQSNRERGGRSGICKECTKQRKGNWRSENAERVKETDAKWRKANPEKLKVFALRTYARHGDKIRAKSREYKRLNPTKRRASDLRKQYGMTLADYDRMVAEQGGVCAICKQTPANGRYKKLHIDHDHATGRVRGLLCDKHNRAIGLFNDDPEMLETAIRYLRPSLDLRAA